MFAGTADQLAKYKAIYAKQSKGTASPEKSLDLDEKYHAALQKLLKESVKAGDVDAGAKIRTEIKAIEEKSGAQRSLIRSNKVHYTLALKTLAANSYGSKAASDKQGLRRKQMALKKEIAELEKKIAKVPKVSAMREGKHTTT